ncbi:MAG: 4Fe-4S binding protein [Clostridia bacterium]
MIKTIIRNRRIIQGLIGALILAATIYFEVSIWIIVFIGLVSGIIFGKVFCRWMCPLGFIMELTLGGNSGTRNLQLYNYHKLGCPIAWISGFMNRFSLFKIRKDNSKCTSCGICDSNCYISTINKEYSLYKNNKANPAIQFSCSKCLTCVEKCPSKSLKYTI